MKTREPTSRLASEMGRARLVADELNSVTKEFTEGLERAEDAIRKLTLGVTASVTLPVADKARDYGLGFQRLGDTWRLVLLESPAGASDWTDKTPLVNASRKLRLLAAAQLVALVTEMTRKAEAEAKTVRGGLKELNSFFDWMGSQP